MIIYLLVRKPVHDFKLAVLAKVAELFDLLKQHVRTYTLHYHQEHRMQLVIYAVMHLSLSVYILTSEPNPTQLNYKPIHTIPYTHSDSNIHVTNNSAGECQSSSQ